ncbi:MAG: hypothetical protein GY862_26095 [Gammaproteobacteria bacterium]|nr:hypothetical protein [Gammaproteobacteria bacterium]
MANIPTQPDDILEWCLHKMEAEGWAAADCLAQFPDQHEELAGLLRLARNLRRAGSVRAPLTFKQQASARLQARLHSTSRPAKIRKSARRWRWATLPLTFLIVLALTLGTTSVAYAADRAKPGDILYGIDLLLERIQLNMASPDEMLDLRLAFAEERLDEALALVQTGDLEHLDDALEYYEQLASDLTQTIDSETEDNTLAALNEAFATHEEKLASLLEQVPEQAQHGISRALEVSRNGRGRAHNAQNGHPASDSDKDTGKPDDTPGGGPPDDKDTGKPDDTPGGGPPDDKDTGKPDDTPGGGPPDDKDTGKPDDKNKDKDQQGDGDGDSNGNDNGNKGNKDKDKDKSNKKDK